MRVEEVKEEERCPLSLFLSGCDQGERGRGRVVTGRRGRTGKGLEFLHAVESICTSLANDIRNPNPEPSEGPAERPKACESSLSSSALLSSLELSDTQVYEPYIRALLGTAAHFCKVVVLN